jgi:hypothetical protein
MTQYSYVVTYDPDSAATDISNYVISIEATDVGTGEVKSAKVKLNAINGKFVTATPVLVQFDKIKIVITDEDSTSYTQIYEIDRVIPIKNSSEGNIVEIELLGQEHHLQKIDVSKQFYFANAFNVAKDISDFFNDVSGTAQPDIQNHDSASAGNNELPKWTYNTYQFGVSELKAYDALMQVVEGLGSSVANKGAGDFYELYFGSNVADTTKINFKAFVSGSLPTAGNEVIITDSTAVNEAPTEGGIDAVTGTLIKAWGAKGMGTLPQSVQDFAGELEAFLLIPYWVAGTYPANSRVQLAGVTYQNTSGGDTTGTPGVSGDWAVTNFYTIQGASSYSEWTKALKDEWQSSGSDPSTANEGKGCWDSNLVIDDGSQFQTWVIQRAYTTAVGASTGQIPSNNLYSGTKFYRGFRVLVDSDIASLAGIFAENSGNDRFGKAYDKNVVQHNGGTAGTYLDWDVIHVATSGEFIAVRQEGTIYKLVTTTWTNQTAAVRGRHCFHKPDSVANVAGYNNTPSDGAGGTYGDTSAVEWTYSYNILSSYNPATYYTTNDYYNTGAWLNFSLPFPENSYFSNTIGSLYGNNATKLEPVALDANNMHLTRSGNVGFNNTEAEDYGTIDGIQFWMKFKWTDSVGTTNQGDFKMRCTMYDTSDNVVTQDFVIPFNDLWAFQKLPFSKFQAYRARTPIANANVLYLRDLEILNVFQWKNIKLISIQWQEVYNDMGQFNPDLSRAWSGAFAGAGTIRLAIDAFSFTKPLLAVTGVITDRVLEPPAMELPDVTNATQLKQIVNAQLEIEKFQHKEFTITTSGKININFGDTFFLTDSRMVNDDDTRRHNCPHTGGTANTIRLVAKRIVYSITKKPGTGAQSFLRTITGIKRIIT